MSISMNNTLYLQEVLLDDVELARSGDKQAFGRLIEQTQNLVSSIAFAIVKDLDSSEDVTQQVYIGAWQQIDTLKKTSSFLPWLRQMTRYKSLNFLRDNKVRQKIVGEQADLILAEFCDPTQDIDENIHAEQSNLILQNFINQLPEESREIVLLYYREEQSTRQVAKLLDQSEANIRQKLSRVRTLLHEKILRKHGKLLLSSAPAIGFSSLVLGTMTTSGPVAAATLGVATASSESSMLGKLSILLGGSMLGAFSAVFAVRLSTKTLLKKLKNDDAKNALLHYRKVMTIWIILSGILLTISYEFTVGWLAPTGTYIFFATGIIFRVRQVNQVIERELYSTPTENDKELRNRNIQKICSFGGLILGVLTGFAGLILGLINSGRLTL